MNELLIKMIEQMESLSNKELDILHNYLLKEKTARVKSLIYRHNAGLITDDEFIAGLGND